MHAYRHAPPYGGARGGFAWLLVAVALLAATNQHPAPAEARSAKTHTRPSPRAAKAVRYALAQRGDPYVWGAEGPGAFDCSGLTWAAWHAAGVDIPRTAAGQLDGLPRVHGRLAPGDLVIYATDGPTRRHVAMVVAARRIVEARGRGVPVRVTRLRPGWLGVVRP
jgi:cell wall-associated NlpC family hydrolase